MRRHTVNLTVPPWESDMSCEEYVGASKPQLKSSFDVGKRSDKSSHFRKNWRFDPKLNEKPWLCNDLPAH